MRGVDKARDGGLEGRRYSGLFVGRGSDKERAKGGDDVAAYLGPNPYQHSRLAQ